MRKYQLSLVLLLMSLGIFVQSPSLAIDQIPQPQYPVLIIDSPSGLKFPKNFRTTTYPYPVDTPNSPTREGLDQLQASGSAQFDKVNFFNMMRHIGQRSIMIVDLRKESHGFLDEIPISWFGERDWENKDRRPKEVDALEYRLLNCVNHQKHVTAYRREKSATGILFVPQEISFHKASSEQNFVVNSGYKYIRFYVLDHTAPDNTQTDRFVQLIKKLPKNTWLHFHCHAGVGRTTTFLALYDIIHNAQKVSLEDILNRQKLMGGADLQKISGITEWKEPLFKTRLQFLQAFYEYVRDPNGYAKRSWSAWLKEISGSKLGA